MIKPNFSGKIKGIILTSIFLLVSVNLFAETWYSLASGDWDDPTIWTLDPAGAVFVNPSNTYPKLSSDNIVILSGKTVTMPDGIAPYDSPLRNLSVICGVLTVDGRLDLRSSDQSTFSAIRGGGKIILGINNFPIGDRTHFVSKGQGEGTVVYNNNYPWPWQEEFFNVEVDFIDLTDNRRLTINHELKVNGSLTIKNGKVILGGDSGAVNVVVSEDLIVEEGAELLSSTDGGVTGFHTLELYGDFINRGTVDFTDGDQYAEPNTSAVKVRFLGASDNTMLCDGLTNLYRIFVNKGTDKTYGLTISANNSNNFTLYGPVTGSTSDNTDGSGGWQKLPLVIENGTLQLGDNIKIDRLGENMNGSSPNEFTIPETARLWINGADVVTGLEGKYWQQNWNGVSVYGELKVSSGAFTCPQYSAGISYYTPVNSTGALVIEGGAVNTPQLAQIDNGAPFIYRQSGGVFNVDVEVEQDHLHPFFELRESTSVFEMSGGTIILAEDNGQDNGGFYVASAEGNYNVTGGTIQVETFGGDCKIYTTAPLYNLKITKGTGGNRAVIVDYDGLTGTTWQPPSLTILNDLTIETNSIFDDGSYQVFIGGALNIGGTYNQSGKLVFNGSQNGSINNTTGGTIELNGLYINKEKHPTSNQFYSVVMGGNSNIEINGTIKLQRGSFDPVNFWPTVTDSVCIQEGMLTSSGTGGLELVGSIMQNIKGKFGKDYDFGRIHLNNANNGMVLASDVRINDFNFSSSGNAKVNMGAYQLKVDGVITNANSERYFYTAGNASDKGLSIKSTIGSSVGHLVTYHLGTSTSDYCYVSLSTIAAQSPETTGYFSITPVNSPHPSTTDPSKVMAYYWKSTVEGFDNLVDNIISLEFTSNKNLKGWSTAYMENLEWQLGDAKYGKNEETLIVDPTANYGSYKKLINSEYTAGLDNGNGQIPIAGAKTYTSTGSHNWHTTSWIDQDGVSGQPGSSDIAIVREGDTVTITESDADASQVSISGMLKVKNGTSGHDIGVIKGSGHLIYEKNGNWAVYTTINGDHTEFCDNPEATIEFTSTDNNLKVFPDQSIIPYYPNLEITGTGTTQIDHGNGKQVELVVLGDFSVNGPAFDIKGMNDGEVEVFGDVIINAGSIKFPEAHNHNMTVYGDIRFIGNGEFIGNIDSKLLTLHGGIDTGTSGVFNFTQTDVVFEGVNSSEVKGDGTLMFHRIYVDKPIAEKLEFTSNFSVNGPTNDASKSLIIKSGECHLNNAAININLTTGGDNYNIPLESKLIVSSGTINASGNSGIQLSGALILNGGMANFDGTGGSNSSFIEYTTSGLSYLEISNSSMLQVGDQIRRSVNTDQGILTYVQNDGLVFLGTKATNMESSRGVFEISGEGSSFSQGESDVILINNSNGSSSMASLYYYPELVNVATGSGFVIGASGEFGVNASQAINNLILAGNSNSHVKLYTNALTVTESLNIGSTTNFDANDLYLYVGGDITNDGTFTPGTGAVFMTGTDAQTINGSAASTLFYDFTKIGGTGELSLELSGVEVNRFLTLEDGSINTNTNIITAKGDVVNNGQFITTSGDGLVMGGSELQGIQGQGSIDVLTINNTAGINLPTQSSAFAIGKKLKLANGIFDIGRNLLEINDEAIIVDASDGLTGFSSGNMIQTNLSFTDAGIKKFFSSSFVGDFVYPIGSFGKYTPITLDVSGNTVNDGSIRVKAANEAHVSVLDPSKVLQYNWTLDADQISGLSADVVMQYENADALGDESKYINAKILLNSDEWNKSDGSIDIAADQIKYSWTGADDLVIDGDYTAGEPDAIPDKLATYITTSDGSWDDENNWATYDPDTGVKGTPGDMIPAGGPSGAIVYVEHELTLPASPSKVAYRTIINTMGIIDVGSTYGHRLGTVSGTGLIKISDGGSLPAGVYDAFIDAVGGTIEYYGSTDYDIMNELPVYNNVTISGSGKRRLPNSDVVVGGSLLIEGANLVNEYNEVLYIAGNLTLQGGGVYTANQGTTSFVGSTTQNIDSEFSDSNAFYNFEIDNLKGVNINSNVEIKNNLKLKNGILNIADGLALTLSSHSSNIVTGGSDNSYVSGKVRKYIVSGSSFVYPLGDGYRYGYIKVLPQGGSLGYWDAQYYSQGKDNTVKSDDVEYVSNSEYWQLSAPYENALAKVTLRWDALSGVDASDVQIVNWTDNTSSGNKREEWDVLPISNVIGDNNSGTVELQNYLEFGYKAGEVHHYLTFGSESEPPAFSWTGDVDTDWFEPGNWSTFEVPHSGSDVTIVNTTNKPVVSALGHVYCNDIEIQKDASLTIQPGARVDVLGSVNCTDSEQLVIQNTTDLPTSVIIGGIVSHNIKSEWTYAEASRYWYIGQAINGATVSDYGTSGVDVIIYNYLEGWNNLTSGTLDAKLEGYSVNFKDANTKVAVTGSINNGELTSSLSEGWHLIGNPYLSYLDVNRESAWDFDNDKIDQTVWIRTDLASVRGFATYNITEGVGANGGSNEIAPGQSFWLNANTTANFKINEAAQIHGTNSGGEGSLKSTSTIEREEVFRFTIGDGVYADELIAVFRPYGSTVLTSRDSKKRFVSNADFPQVYAIKSSTQVVINIASSLIDEQSIPLGISVPESKSYVFKATNLNTFLPTYDMSLEDKLMGEYYDLRINPELEIEMEEGTSDDRFVLHFAQRSTDLEEPVIAKKPTIYAADGDAYINIDTEQFNNNTGGCFVEVYDFAGKKHIIQDLHAALTQLKLPESNKLWIIVVRIGNKSYHEKVSSFN
ncbi:hypothetical protein [Saccharicrinis aurantiacus]|uniref:hypothetical protein n=1 Tax=Saccharicrinis aurantiacus TaxID=1849719 RepID=UPI00094F7422|nr:hypothetical protein [Saccharicrinis aurantiacus]